MLWVIQPIFQNEDQVARPFDVDGGALVTEIAPRATFLRHHSADSIENNRAGKVQGFHRGIGPAPRDDGVRDLHELWNTRTVSFSISAEGGCL